MNKKVTLLFLINLFLGIQMYAQSGTESKASVGFQLNQFQTDFGLGVNIAMPPIIKEKLVIRLRANAMFYEQIIDAKTDWTVYSNIMIGISPKQVKVADFLALYGEGGVIGILPSSEFSTSNFNIGGYGLFGFEFYFAPEFNYFIELGGVGTGATADKLLNDPIYSNGFLASVGWRINF